MVETNNEQVMEKAEADAFDREFMVPTETPPPATPAPTADEVTPPDSPTVAPKFVPVTEEDLKTLRDTATLATTIKAAMEKQFGTAFGKMGSLEQTVRALHERTPTGHTVVLTDDDLAELKEDFPELTSNLIKGLNKALGKVAVGGAPGPGALTHETVTKLIADAVATAEARVDDTRLSERVTATYPDWMDVINGPVGADGFRHGVGADGKQTAYRQWMAAQSQDVQHMLMTTRDPRAVIQSLDDFTKQSAPAVPSTRSRRLVEAVPPKGSTSGVSTEQTEDDGFREGLKMMSS